MPPTVRFRPHHGVALVCLLVIVLGAGAQYARSRTPVAVLLEAPSLPVAPPTSASAALNLGIKPGSMVVVHVVGEVRHSGVLKLADGARVNDAINQCGGATPQADLQAINLAARLQDGQQVVVPAKGSRNAPNATLSFAAEPSGPPLTTAPQPPTLVAGGRAKAGGGSGGPRGVGPRSGGHSSRKKVLVGKLRVNQASLAELEQLPGVGPATAQRIVDYRSQHGAFHTLEDMHGVKGLGPKKLDKLRDHVLF